jgi:hypothetical protein
MGLAEPRAFSWCLATTAGFSRFVAVFHLGYVRQVPIWACEIRDVRFRARLRARVGPLRSIPAQGLLIKGRPLPRNRGQRTPAGDGRRQATGAPRAGPVAEKGEAFGRRIASFCGRNGPESRGTGNTARVAAERFRSTGWIGRRVGSLNEAQASDPPAAKLNVAK